MAKKGTTGKSTAKSISPAAEQTRRIIKLVRDILDEAHLQKM
jgi:hypothetical protein